jgi:phosphoenolpyruvate-protein kinase (PTS system EI component)
MKRNLSPANSVIAAVALLLSASFIGCNSPSQKVEQADANVAEAKKDLVQAQNEYAVELSNFKQETDKTISANEKKIYDIRIRMEKDKMSAKEEYKRLISELEQKNSALKQRMDSYQDESQVKWDLFKTEFNKDMNDLQESLNNFFVVNKK